MQLGNSTLGALAETSNTLHVLAGGQAITPHQGIVNQNEDTLFNESFAISTHTAFNKATEMKLALVHQNLL